MVDTDLVVAGAGGGPRRRVAGRTAAASTCWSSKPGSTTGAATTSMSTAMIPGVGSRWRGGGGIADSPGPLRRRRRRRKTDGAGDEPTSRRAPSRGGRARELVEWLADDTGPRALLLVTDFHYPGHSVRPPATRWEGRHGTVAASTTSLDCGGLLAPHRPHGSRPGLVGGQPSTALMTALSAARCALPSSRRPTDAREEIDHPGRAARDERLRRRSGISSRGTAPESRARVYHGGESLARGRAAHRQRDSAPPTLSSTPTRAMQRFRAEVERTLVELGHRPARRRDARTSPAAAGRRDRPATPSTPPCLQASKGPPDGWCSTGASTTPDTAVHRLPSDRRPSPARSSGPTTPRRSRRATGPPGG